jgi:hypothetical protein
MGYHMLVHYSFDDGQKFTPWSDVCHSYIKILPSVREFYCITFSSVIYKGVSWNPCGEEVHGSQKKQKAHIS